MSVDELSNKYMNLRSALANAYGQPVWDSSQIDRLTEAIADTEYALAASGSTADFLHVAAGARCGNAPCAQPAPI